MGKWTEGYLDGWVYGRRGICTEGYLDGELSGRRSIWTEGYLDGGVSGRRDIWTEEYLDWVVSGPRGYLNRGQEESKMSDAARVELEKKPTCESVTDMTWR